MGMTWSLTRVGIDDALMDSIGCAFVLFFMAMGTISSCECKVRYGGDIGVLTNKVMGVWNLLKSCICLLISINMARFF